MEKLRYDGNQITSWDKCDWRPKKTAKLSDAIRAGASLIGESRVCWLSDGCGCALGAAMASTGMKSQMELPDAGMSFPNVVAERFGVPLRITNKVSNLHFNKDMDRMQIADWLESQGY